MFCVTDKSFMEFGRKCIGGSRTRAKASQIFIRGRRVGIRRYNLAEMSHNELFFIKL